MTTASYGNIAENLFGIEFTLQSIFQTTTMMLGIYLIFIGLLKIGRYRTNPIETTLGSVITFFIIGLALIALSFISMQINKA